MLSNTTRIVLSFLLLTTYPLHALEKSTPNNLHDEVTSRGTESGSIGLEDSDGEPSSVINNSVSAISGSYFESEIDLLVPGPQHILAERHYCSTQAVSNYWGFNNSSTVEVYADPEEKVNSKIYGYNYRCDVYAQVLNAENSLPTSACFYTQTTDVDAKNKKPLTFLFALGEVNKGYTNTGRGEIGGRTWEGNSIFYMKTFGYKIATLTTGAGVLKVYRNRPNINPNGATYVLAYQQWPIGNTFSYESKSDYHYQVRSYNKENTQTFGSLDYYVNKSIKKTDRIVASDGREVKLRYDNIRHKKKDNMLLFEVQRPNLPTIKYDYVKSETQSRPLLSYKSLPDNRFLQTVYYAPGANNLLGKNIQLKDNDPRINRVLCQKAPSSTDTTPITLYTFDYTLKLVGKNTYEGHTDVIDALNHKTRYVYNDKSNLKYVIKYVGNNTYTPYTTETMGWYLTKLTYRILKDSKDNVIFMRLYTYDDDFGGNIVEDTLTANFSGLKQEEYKKLFTYSKDTLNLCTKIIDLDCITQQIYKPGTDLLIAKLTGDGKTIHKREFYDYDCKGIQIKHIVDNGNTEDINNLSGVTQRTLTYITPKNQAPCVGLPLIVEEKYLDTATNQEKLLSKKVNSYTREGWMTSQEVYDANNALRYTLKWEYNKNGCVIAETNAMGLTTYRQYDENNNLITETSPSGHSRQNTYDYCNRLISTLETDGHIVLSTTHKYDYMGNKTHTVDYLGNETQFIYDEFGRVIESMLPEVTDMVGNVYRPRILKTYDELNNVTSETDGRGYTVTKNYTFTGKPYEINYPDGSSEKFVYNIKGSCIKSIGKNGTYNIYTYDIYERLLKQETFSPNKELLATIANTYDSFHLISSTDAAGHITNYTYDPAGRKKSVSKGDSRTDFEYDALGRLYKTIEWYGNDAEIIVKVNEYDLLNRVIEERVENSKGEILKKMGSQFDAEGNRTEIITYTDNGTSITHTEYNLLKEPVKIIDPLGNETHYHYVFSKKGLLKTVVDALGNFTESQQDALGRVTSVVRKNLMGKEVSKNMLFYDASGNKVKNVATVICEDRPTREVITEWEYDTAGRVTKLYDAKGSVDQKITCYTYLKAGQKDTITKADGVQVLHVYDDLSRLTRIYSSDGSVDYSYEYDPNSKPIKVVDNLTHQETYRRYDENDRLYEEVYANGLALQYAYDRTGRPIQLTLPDGTSVKYTYDALHLKSVTRDSETNSYRHTYDEYDLSGRLLETSMINDLGKISYKYDGIGRLVESYSPYFNENHIGYDAVGNLISTEIDDGLAFTPYKYNYDELYQVSSEEGVTSHQYVHDSLNNRIEKDGIAYQVNDLNQLIAQDSWQYIYDMNGNLKRKEKESDRVSYIYDAMDRLVEVQKEGSIVSYTYDAFNRRLTKAVQNLSTNSEWVTVESKRFLYAGQNEIGSYENDKIVELRVLGTGKGAEIGGAVALEIGDKVYAPLHDQNGNVRQIVDVESKKIVETYRYSAFGEETLLTGNGSELEKSVNPWRFSSKRFDDETGFVFFGRRYYAPELGRWMTMDPLGYEAGPNLYAYVLNSPLFHFDLYGLRAETFGPNWYTWPGRFLEIMNHHLNCVPILRHVGFAITSLLQFERPRFHYFKQHPSGFLGYVGIEQTGQNQKLCMNGINVDTDGAKENAEHLSKQSNEKVGFFYNSDHGILGNILLDVLGMKAGFDNAMVRRLHNQLMQSAKIAAANGTHVDVDAHSMGAEVLYQASKDMPPELKKYLNIATYGGARMIPEDGYRSCYNYVNLDDAVPFLADPIGCVRGMFKGGPINVTYIKCPGLPFISHEFQNPAYTYAQQLQIQRMKESYEN